MISKKTVISTSVGTIMACASGLWVIAADFNTAVAQIESNKKSIQSLEIRAIDSELTMLRKERRELNRMLREHPVDSNLLEDQEEVDDEIAELTEIRACLIDSTKEVCK